MSRAVLGHADAAQEGDLIEFPPDELPYESLKECLTELHILNPFQRYQAFMSLTLAAGEKPSTLMGKMCSLLPLNRRLHKDECFLCKSFFLDHLPPNIRTHLMRKDISNPCKLAAKADEIWQSYSTRSVNSVSTASLSSHDLNDVNTLPQPPQPRPAPCVGPRPASHTSHPQPPSSSCKSSLCWYHHKHGDQAQHCRSPCVWVQRI